jgi:hypothetical protein
MCISEAIHMKVLLATSKYRSIQRKEDFDGKEESQLDEKITVY